MPVTGMVGAFLGQRWRKEQRGEHHQHQQEQRHQRLDHEGDDIAVHHDRGIEAAIFVAVVGIEEAGLPRVELIENGIDEVAQVGNVPQLQVAEGAALRRAESGPAGADAGRTCRSRRRPARAAASWFWNRTTSACVSNGIVVQVEIRLEVAGRRDTAGNSDRPRPPSRPVAPDRSRRRNQVGELDMRRRVVIAAVAHPDIEIGIEGAALDVDAD